MAIASLAPLARAYGPRSIDDEAVQHAAADLLRALGADVEADGQRETPRRVGDGCRELLTAQVLRSRGSPRPAEARPDESPPGAPRRGSRSRSTALARAARQRRLRDPQELFLRALADRVRGAESAS